MCKNFNEILVIGLGTTPQVFTECLYYYSHSYYKDVRTFSQIKVYTTSEGRKKLLSALDEGHLMQMQSDLGGIEFPFDPERDIVVYADASGAEIDDMRTSSAMSDSMFRLYEDFRKFTSDEQTRITATVAGGRKSMSAAMALAFQLYAREQDELFHILVPDTRMSVKNWYYPSDPADPEQLMEVTQIPVIKVGRYLNVDLNRDPVELQRLLQLNLKERAPLKKLIVQKNKFSDGENSLTLPPRSAVLIRTLLRRRLHAGCSTDCPGCELCTLSFGDLTESIHMEIIPDYKRINRKLAPQIEKYINRRKPVPTKNEAKDSKKSKAVESLGHVLSEDLSFTANYIAKNAPNAVFRETFHFRQKIEGSDERRYGIRIDPRIIEGDLEVWNQGK